MIRYDSHAALAREIARGDRYRAMHDMAVPAHDAWFVPAGGRDSASRVTRECYRGVAHAVL